MEENKLKASIPGTILNIFGVILDFLAAYTFKNHILNPVWSGVLLAIGLTMIFIGSYTSVKYIKKQKENQGKEQSDS